MSLIDVVVGDSAVESSVGSGELAEAVRVVGLLAGVVDASGGAASRPGLAGVVAGCQGLINSLTAVQDVAIMHVAAIEEEWGEDGLVTESRRAPGHVALDAPDVVAGALRVSHGQAQRRVSLAARLAAAGLAADDEDSEGADSEGGVDAEPGVVEDEGDAGPAGSGLGGVHEAMRDGRLDGYAASVLGEELEQAPPEVARAVVAALEDYFGRECASALRRRCRRALVKISPDLLRQRAERARAEAGLRRWAEEPGVDRWSGTFPSEQAAMGWAAVDALARRYVKEGVCERVEQARGKALIDLVTGNASIDVTVVITTSQDTDPDSPDGPNRPAADGGPDPLATTDGPHEQNTPEPRDDPANDDEDDPAIGGEGRDDSSESTAECDLPAAFAGNPPAARVPGAASASGRNTARSATPDSSVEDLVEAYGPFAGDAMLVRRAWLVALLRGAASGVRVRFARCHRRTGALLGDAGTATGAYRPGERLKALVRVRDGRCRFPGCSVSARFCDLDHARPWPTGPTTAANLMCLCRRHHRIKQRPGWSVRLSVDGTATWTDPVGRHRTTWPRNHLDLLTLPAPTGDAGGEPLAGTGASARPESTVEEASTLETILEVLGDGHHQGTRSDRLPPRRLMRGELRQLRTDRPRLRYHPTRRRDQHHGAAQGVPHIDVEPPPF